MNECKPLLRGAKLGAMEAIILCIVPAATAPCLTHAAMAGGY